MTTITVTHEGEQLVHLSSWTDDELHIECLRSSYKAPQLRAIAAALTEAADKLEPQPEPKFKVGDRVRYLRNEIFLTVTNLVPSHNYNIVHAVADSGEEWSVPAEDLELAPEPAPTSEADKEVMRDALLYGMGIRKGETHIPLEECLNPANKPNITAWWGAYLAALTGLIQLESYDWSAYPDQCAEMCSKHATAAVEARRKMEENQP